MRHRAFLAVVGSFLAAPAYAAVPVADAPREATEKGIADCMTKARVSKQATLQPSQGITGSMVSPGQGSVPAAGGKNVTGSGASYGSGTVSGIDFSAVVPDTGISATTLNLGTIAQTVSALASISQALGSNNSNTQAASLAIGALAVAHGAWNQNSGARTNNGAMWNQLIMTSLVTAQLFNQRGINVIGGSNRGAYVMSFDAAKATLIGTPTSYANTNAVVLPLYFGK